MGCLLFLVVESFRLHDYADVNAHNGTDHGGTDGTDYTRSFTARSFVPHYAQRISTACVMYGAEGILKGIRKASHTRLRRALAHA